MDSTREKIIQAAEMLFSEKGYAGVTTKELASEAGVSEVTLFRNFDSKRNLFKNILKENMHPFKVRLYLENDVKYDVEADLKSLADIIFETYQKNLPLLRMVLKDTPPPREHRKAHDENLKGCLKDYFMKMYEEGKIFDPPDKAMKFFLLNITSILSESILRRKEVIDREYYTWMVAKVIEALKSDK